MFQSSVEVEEATLKQRLRDAEARRSREWIDVPAPTRVPTLPVRMTVVEPSEQSASDRDLQIRTYAPSELEIYEEY